MSSRCIPSRKLSAGGHAGWSTWWAQYLANGLKGELGNSRHFFAGFHFCRRMFSQRAPPTGLGRVLHNTVCPPFYRCSLTSSPFLPLLPHPPPPFYRCSLTSSPFLPLLPLTLLPLSTAAPSPSSPFLPLLPHLLPLSTAAHVHLLPGNFSVWRDVYRGG